MNAENRRAMEAVFGEAKLVEDIRTEILFTQLRGGIFTLNTPLGAGLGLYVARVPDAEFYTGRHWASCGPTVRNDDDDGDTFVVPCVIRPGVGFLCERWARVLNGRFVTTESGVVVLDINGMTAWEGYTCPGKRDYAFDRRRLEKSAAALKMMVVVVG